MWIIFVTFFDLIRQVKKRKEYRKEKGQRRGGVRWSGRR
jgi:hypothetical protein